MTKTADDFLKNVAPFAIECPDIIINEFVEQSMIRFCSETGVMAEWLEIETVADTQEYILDVSIGIPNKVFNVILNESLLLYESTGKPFDDSGCPQAYRLQGEEIYLYPTPDSAYTIKAFVMSIPDRSNPEISDNVFNAFGETIINGALSRLLLMPDKAWSAPEEAGRYHRLYVEGSVNARININLHDKVAFKCI